MKPTEADTGDGRGAGLRGSPLLLFRLAKEAAWGGQAGMQRLKIGDRPGMQRLKLSEAMGDRCECNG